ncbi:MAG: hypothetical protein AAB459_00690 [Patescibacteria group bacterium]
MSFISFKDHPSHEFMQCPDLVRDKEEEEVHEVFGRLAAPHQGGSADLALLPYDPEKYPEQRLDIVGMRGPKADIATIRNLANAAYRGFGFVEDGLRARPDLLNNLVLEISGGSNVLTVLDHGTIINSPIFGAALFTTLHEFSAEHEALESLHPNMSLIASKLITRLAVFGSIPSSRVLTNIYYLRYSIPPSRNVRRSNIPPQLRKRFNAAMISSYANEPATDAGEITVISGSGSTDVVKRSHLPRRTSTIHMGPVATGTVALMQQCDRILPSGLNVSGNQPAMAIGFLRPAISEDTGAVGVMGQIAGMMTDATGIEHAYHPTRESFERAIG